MQAEPAKPQGVAQAANIQGTMDGLLAWTNAMCSPSVHQYQKIAGCEKEYSNELRFIERTLSDVMVRLRSAINPTCPINKLPPEVLTRCFLYLTPDFPLTIGSYEVNHDCILITHVCKYWRAVALNFSGLWDHFESTRPEILAMYLKLSGSRPLEVCLKHVGNRFRQTMADSSCPCEDTMLDLLLPAALRIRSLTMHTNWIPPHNQCRFVLGPLPELETLSITSDIGWENKSDNQPQKRLRALFKAGLPRLRRLFIPECTPWPNNDFKNLTFLCLYNQSALEEELPELLQMLRGCPNLEELYIRQHESSYWIDDPPPNPGPTFPAHSLRRFRLHNFSTSAIACVLSTMLLQPNGVAVHLSDTLMTTDTFAEILPLFPPQSALGSTEKLGVYHESSSTFGIMFCCTGGSLKIGGSLSWHEGEDKPEAAISLLGYIYQECAQTLKELWIHNYNDAGAEYIFDNFSCFNLEKLVFVGGGEDSDRLCEVLDPGSSGAQDRDLPAPRLHSIAIHGIYQQPQLERLVALCEARSRTDHPLHEVSVAWRAHLGDIPKWMTRLCRSSPTPTHINTDEWDESQMMELPTALRDWEGPWWPSWDETIVGETQYGA